jgi:hypothetical protein
MAVWGVYWRDNNKWKVACGTFSALQPCRPIVPFPQWVPHIHLQRRHALHRHERPLLYTFVIHGGTWFFYMTDSFTSLPKEGMRRIYQMPEKSNDFGRVWTRELGFQRSACQPLDHRNRLLDAYITEWFMFSGLQDVWAKYTQKSYFYNKLSQCTPRNCVLESGVVSPLIKNCNRCRWVVSFTPRPFYRGQMIPVITE